MHQKQSLMQSSLPRLLFTECHKYCVQNWEVQVAETQSEKTCISNCQDKTYRAFDIYMIAAVRFAAKKNYKDYIDVSKFTEMEVEHGHDTASVITAVNQGGHLHPEAYQKFAETVDSELSQVKSEALK